MNETYESVIGLEVHAQLMTDSKIFATSATTAGLEPNSATDPVTLGLPGALPVLNRRVVDLAVKLGVALKCEIQRESIFSRKHYFYPDLPKGYQISQYDKPICLKGGVQIQVGGETKKIGLTRIHLEEDAGKNIHLDSEAISVVDLNRAGVPLVEIVSEPEMRTPEEAGAYMRKLRQIVRYLDICDGNMDEGSLRCDANVSVRKRGAKEFGVKVEIKNLNSFRFVEKAIAHEVERQIAVLESGGTISQETRLWDDAKGSTRVMRTKEQAADYRYFPDPDLLPLVVDNNWIDRIADSMPELPDEVFQRLKNAHGLDDYYAEILTEEKFTARYFDQAVSMHNNPAAIANWITTELFGRLNREGMEMSACSISPENLALLVKLIDTEVISGKIAKTVFDEMFASGASPDNIIEQRGLKQVSDATSIRQTIVQVLKDNPEQVAAFKDGKTKMFGYFVGQIMKVTEGKANPRLVNDILKEELEK